jgi:hypothetical protein
MMEAGQGKARHNLAGTVQTKGNMDDGCSRFRVLDNNMSREAIFQMVGWFTGSYDADHNNG